MPEKSVKKLSFIIFTLLAVAVLVFAPVAICGRFEKESAEGQEVTLISVWQIDNFEGGKGSRAGYLQSLGDKFSKESCYFNVKSLSSSAARENIKEGTVPDLISYGAGMCGIESLLNAENPYVCWAHGGYCLLSVDPNCDFSDVNDKNTVTNAGTENLSSAAALFLNLQNAKVSSPTSAYVELLNGKYKYLLGTQRDIYRLKTRNADFKVKPVTEFNDLFMNISILTKEQKKVKICEEFIKNLKNDGKNLIKLGLMGDIKLYSDEMYCMEGLDYNYKVSTPVSFEQKERINAAVANSDINLLKNLLK